MAIEWIIAGVVASIGGYMIYYLPSFFDRRAERHRDILELSDEFYGALDKMLRAEPGPGLIVFLGYLNEQFANPSLVRRLVWAAVRGRMRAHARNPSPKARDLLREINNLSKDRLDDFATVLACSLLSSALKAPVAGFFYLQFLQPVMEKAKPEVTRALVPEIATFDPAAA